jgi:hypothetical protein
VRKPVWFPRRWKSGRVKLKWLLTAGPLCVDVTPEDGLEFRVIKARRRRSEGRAIVAELLSSAVTHCLTSLPSSL